MRIHDLYENNFDENLEKDILDILMMFRNNGANKTDLNNIISELEKNGYSINEETLKDIIDKSKNFEIIEDDKVQLVDDPDEGEENADEVAQGDPTIQDQEEYNPAKSKAKQMTDKILKKKT